MRDIPYFKFWCMKVIPLVYDESLSYYEVLCKVVKYINDLIDSDREIVENIGELRSELTTVQEWIDSFNYEPLLKTVEKMVQEYLTTGVRFGLTNDGYFCANIPKSWSYVHFDTIMDYQDPLYGHLILSYD